MRFALSSGRCLNTAVARNVDCLRGDACLARSRNSMARPRTRDGGRVRGERIDAAGPSASITVRRIAHDRAQAHVIHDESRGFALADASLQRDERNDQVRSRAAGVRSLASQSRARHVAAGSPRSRPPTISVSETQVGRVSGGGGNKTARSRSCAAGGSRPWW